jgi:hypothetical protein
MRNLITGFAATLLVAGSIACAGMGEPDPAWDETRYDGMTQTAYEQQLEDEGVFDTWDADRSGWVDENEFVTGSFGVWDTDGDRFLDADEWRVGTETWGDDDFGMLNAWDRNRDMRVDRNEWDIGIADSQVMDRWDSDRDSRIDYPEFSEASFDVFDTNDDSIVDDDEWDAGFGTWS